MKQYEITFITKEGFTTENDPVAKEIASQEGKIINVLPLGQKQFTYPIKKEKSGFYTSVTFELDPEKISNLNRKLGLKEEVLRYLIIIAPKTKPVTTESATKEKPVKEKEIEKEIEKIVEAEEPEKREEKIEESDTEEKVEQEIEAPKEPAKKVKTVKVKKEKPIEEKPKVEIEEPTDEQERLEALDKKLDELLKE